MLALVHEKFDSKLLKKGCQDQGTFFSVHTPGTEIVKFDVMLCKRKLKENACV